MVKGGERWCRDHGRDVSRVAHFGQLVRVKLDIKLPHIGRVSSSLVGRRGGRPARRIRAGRGELRDPPPPPPSQMCPVKYFRFGIQIWVVIQIDSESATTAALSC